MGNTYTLITVSHRSFKKARTAIVSVPEIDNCMISFYCDMAKARVCERLNVPVEETVVFDWKIMGDDLLFL